MVTKVFLVSCLEDKLPTPWEHRGMSSCNLTKNTTGQKPGFGNIVRTSITSSPTGVKQLKICHNELNSRDTSL
jgi:hypothetical protein